jgi:hypothetical protein
VRPSIRIRWVFGRQKVLLQDQLGILQLKEAQLKDLRRNLHDEKHLLYAFT